MNARGFFVSSGLAYAASGISIICSAAFYGFSLRIGSSAFGALSAIIALQFLLRAGRNAIANTVVIHAADNEQLLMPIARQSVRLGIILAGTIGGLFLLSAPILERFLHITTPAPFVLIGIAALPTMFAGIVDGILNVQQRFGALSLSTTIGPFTHLVLAIILFQDGYQDIDAGWIILGGQLCGCLNIFFVDRSFLDDLPTMERLRTTLWNAAALFCASILFGASNRLDVLWARHALSSDRAGTYAIAASIALVLFLINSGIARIASVQLRAKGVRILWLSYALIWGTSCAFGGLFVLMGEAALSAVAGRSVTIEWSLLIPLFIAMTCYGIIVFDYLCLNVLTRSIHARIATALVVLQGIALFFFGTSAIAIAWAQCTAMISMMFVSTFMLFRALKRGHSPRAIHPFASHLLPHG